MHICVTQRQWVKSIVDFITVEPLATNISEILIRKKKNYFQKIQLNKLSAKYQPFFRVSMCQTQTKYMYLHNTILESYTKENIYLVSFILVEQ